MLLLRVLHGSRLYGWSRTDSDWDFIEVHDKLPGNKKASQRIKYGFDVKKFSLSFFMMQAMDGNPAILETMFAPDSHVSADRIRQLRLSFRASPSVAFRSYEGVKHSMLAIPGVKGQRNFERLSHDFDRLLEYGRFDPTAYGVHLKSRGI